MRTALDTYFQEIGACAALSRGQEQALAIAAKAGDTSARQRLIESNARWAVTLAKRFRWTGVPLDDLIQEANIALIKAVDTFDPSKQRRLSTYSARIIIHALLRLRHGASIVSVPKCVPRSHEYQAYLKRAMSTDALDEAIPNRPPYGNLDAEDLRLLERALAVLSERDREIVEMLAAGWKPGEVARLFDVTRTRVRQIEAQSLERMREALRGTPALAG